MMDKHTHLKRWLLIGLFTLGALEISYGLIVGPLGILAREGTMYLDLVHNDGTESRAAALGGHIRALKDQWHVVALFGIANILFGLLFLREGRARAKQESGAEGQKQAPEGSRRDC